MYLIGSKQFRDGDWDIVLEDEPVKSSKEIDICPKELGLLEVCQKYETGETLESPIGTVKLIAPQGLMLIRRSHLHRSLNFPKNIMIYHKFKEELGEIEDLSLLKKITKLNKDHFGDPHPSLNKSKKDFFDDYVTKYYEHDDIHKVTCYYDKPIYELLKDDDDKVWCSKSKFDLLPFEDKLKCVREEGFVIALERFIIPKMKNSEKFPPQHIAFEWSLNKICTTLTSGWFRDFAIDNYPEIMKHSYNFLEKFNAAFGKG